MSSKLNNPTLDSFLHRRRPKCPSRPHLLQSICSIVHRKSNATSLAMGDAEFVSYSSYSRKRKAKETPSITLNDGAVARPSTPSKPSKRLRIAHSTQVLTESQAMSQTMPETTFRDLENLLAFVEQKTAAFADGKLKEQYVLIRRVPRDVFEDLLIRSARLHYDFESGDLVAKLMPGAPHNDATAILIQYVLARTTEMGVPMVNIRPTTTNTYYSASSAKEGDAGLRPIPERRRMEDWPTLVIECGVSESLARLQIDAGWWLMTSKGDVKLVIVISFNFPAKKFILEKWQLGPPSGPNKRAQSDPEYRVPRSMASIIIAPDATSNNFNASDELVIEFADLFLRQPVSPEVDLVVTKKDLEAWADMVMIGLQ